MVIVLGHRNCKVLARAFSAVLTKLVTELIELAFCDSDNFPDSFNDFSRDLNCVYFVLL